MEAIEFIESLKNNQGYNYQVGLQNNHCIIEASNHLTDGSNRTYASTKKEAVFIAVSDFAQKFNNKEL
jgi:hypothetical protein